MDQIVTKYEPQRSIAVEDRALCMRLGEIHGFRAPESPIWFNPTIFRVPSHDYLWVWISENSKIQSKIHLYIQRRALSQTAAGYRVIAQESTIQYKY